MTSAQAVGARLQPLEAWFAGRGWQIFPFQRTAWTAYLSGQSGLIHAPTGTGKSLAAWGGPLLDDSLPADQAPGLTVLWITPLRALAEDTRANLTAPLETLGLPWTVEVRSGDSSAAARARQRRRLPTALVTTPESLSLLLSYADTRRQLASVRAVVVDEWHELLGSKRGVQLQLCLAWLRARNPSLRTWGLSATLGNVPQAAAALLGSGRQPTLISGDVGKQHRITSLLPATVERFPWAGHAGLQMLDAVIDRLEHATSTLLFTNTRSQAERWFDALLRARLDWIGEIALHHGSLDTDLRREVETRVRSGALRCVVATSSLDLGVDFTPVSQVIQVGSPKGVARLLQRAGRSGHQPGGVSEIFCAPTHALELVEFAAARAAAAAGAIESRQPPPVCLDVLAQHLVTLAAGGGITPQAALQQARDTYSFARLADADWSWLLEFVTRGGPALGHYPQYQRLQLTDGLLQPASETVSRRHRMAIGTITADASVRVKFQGGAYLGMVEEAFITRLRPGDRFQFAGRTLELKRVRDMVADVKLAGGTATAVPRWAGGRLPLSNELADAVLDRLDAFRDGGRGDPELQTAAPLLDLQARWSDLPGRDRLLVERTRSRDGESLFFYPFAGRFVHEGLAALFAWRLSRRQPATFTLSCNDYGFELLTREPLALEATELPALFDPGDLEADVLAAVNAAELARRQFRDIARIAGLVFQGYPGAGKSTRQIQASSALIFDVLQRHDPDNALPRQALREVLDTRFELDRLGATLERMGRQTLCFHETSRLTPLAFPLWAERLGARLSSETWLQRIERMRLRLERAAAAPPRRRTRAG